MTRQRLLGGQEFTDNGREFTETSSCVDSVEAVFLTPPTNNTEMLFNYLFPCPFLIKVSLGLFGGLALPSSPMQTRMPVHLRFKCRHRSCT